MGSECGEKNWAVIINYAFFKSLRLDKSTKGRECRWRRGKGPNTACECSHIKSTSISTFKTFYGTNYEYFLKDRIVKKDGSSTQSYLFFFPVFLPLYNI